MTGNASTRAVGMSAANEPKSPTPMGGASVSEVLGAAADLLEKPGAWTQGGWARDGLGDRVVSTSSAATCWCAMGAMIRVAFATGRDADGAVDRLAKLVGANIGKWNDHPARTQAEVVDTLRQAARQASNPTAEGV